MKLRTITGNESVYHLTSESALLSISCEGLTAGNAARFGHVGNGIYIFYLEGDINRATNMAEYLALDDFALLETAVALDTLLMDEDTLDNEDALEIFAKIYPALAGELHRIYETTSDTDFSLALIRFIERHKIAPTPKLLTHFGHYSFLTARTTQRKLPVGRIWVWDPAVGLVEQ